LKCPECTYTSALEGSFLDVALHIPQVGGREKAHLLEELFKLNTAEEQLGTENAWECSKCSKKVQALKSLNYKSLPPVLIVNLKRIGFDAVCMLV
jgi:ubiquitin C-terminal hydrolase